MDVVSRRYKIDEASSIVGGGDVGCEENGSIVQAQFHNMFHQRISNKRRVGLSGMHCPASSRLARNLLLVKKSRHLGGLEHTGWSLAGYWSIS